MNIAAYPQHESYIDSGIDWIGEVPSTWSVEPGRQCLYESKEKNTGMKESTVLSLSYGRVIVKDEDKLTGLVPESFETYQVVQPGDIIIRGTDLQNDMTSLRTGLARNTGIITSAYINLRPKADIDPKFLHYLLHSYDVKKVFYALGSGLRQNLSYEDFKYLRLPIPSPEEQRAIAAFLDGKCATIDEAVRIKEEQIRLLAERRQILIQQAVTRGLNPAAPMKDSGIDWIGQIPAHWEAQRFKYLFEQSRLPVRPGDEVVTSFRDGQVTLRSNRRLEGFTEAIIEGGYQGIRVGQLVLNSMDAFEGAIGVSESDGKCTPEYVICDPIQDGLSQQYFAYLLREMALARYIQVICNAVRQRAVRIRFNNLAHRFVVVPPADEQKHIVEFVEATKKRIGDAITLKETQITALREYKTSLINAAVTGKIKVL
ncbi:restriction endonuclease subunit S [Pseudodonghicola xiamenensis]|uniref:Type I restriction endonuclease subunit S n=1 Tax=Pseudodonghicola xiamenensis TaxID=337702 RepID=A0A8J3H7K7_9RHOB|nr:restriction endonuclease subunit S [Pseudodonghicola xiamenensis]GHG88161.1 type I restriction endonuclease subunit S [Pseudodonghicola xiamenensis]